MGFAPARDGPKAYRGMTADTKDAMTGVGFEPNSNTRSVLLDALRILSGSLDSVSYRFHIAADAALAKAAEAPRTLHPTPHHL